MCGSSLRAFGERVLARGDGGAEGVVGLGQRVVIEQQEDPSIIGGIITNVGGKVYDGSVRSQLENFRARMRRGQA